MNNPISILDAFTLSLLITIPLTYLHGKATEAATKLAEATAAQRRAAREVYRRRGQ